MADRFAHLSGDRVLDVLNTVDWRLDPERAIEQLATYPDVLAWCVESGGLSLSEAAELSDQAKHDPAAADDSAEEFRRLREDAYAALVGRCSAAAGRVSTRATAALDLTTLRHDGRVWRRDDVELALSTPTHRLARGLVALMTDERIARLGQCHDETCGWVYLDTSPRRNRRWCAAKDCGDRNRARAYYRRRTSTR